MIRLFNTTSSIGGSEGISGTGVGFSGGAVSAADVALPSSTPSSFCSGAADEASSAFLESFLSAGFATFPFLEDIFDRRRYLVAVLQNQNKAVIGFFFLLFRNVEPSHNVLKQKQSSYKTNTLDTRVLSQSTGVREYRSTRARNKIFFPSTRVQVHGNMEIKNIYFIYLK